MPDFNNMSQVMKNTVDVKKIQRFALKSNVQILVGFPSGLMHTSVDKETGEAVTEETAELAKRLSYGDAKTPPRPFLEDGIESQEESLTAELKAQAAKVQNGEKANWDKVGTMAVGAIQDFVRGDYYRSNAPNAEKTIEDKGSDTPLIDTAAMLNSTTYIVKEGGK